MDRMAIPSYRDDFDFDIFVVYGEADEAWCLDELIPQMKSAGLRVCTPEDGILGRPIPDNFDQLANRSQAIAGIFSNGSKGSLAFGWLTSYGRFLTTRDTTRKFIPCEIESGTVPEDFSHLQKLRFPKYSNVGSTIEKLVVAVSTDENQTAKNEDSPSRESFQMQMAHYLDFTDRQEEMNSIHQAINDSGEDHNMVGLYGKPGYGKTQLAIEYVYRYRETYTGVFWVNASKGIEAGLAGLYDQMSESEINNIQTQESKAKEAARRIHKLHKPLLVLDELENLTECYEPILSGLPPLTEWPVRVLYTKMNTKTDSYPIKVIEVDRLPTDYAIRFLLKRFPPAQRGAIMESLPAHDPMVRDAKEICCSLDCMPLALAVARIQLYMDDEKALGEFLSYLKQEDTTVVDQIDALAPNRKLPTSLHDPSIRRAFHNLYCRLDDHAQTLFTTIGIFHDRNNIPAFLAQMFAGLDICTGPFNPKSGASAERHLVEHGIVQKRDHSSWIVHSLLHQFVKHTGEEREFYIRNSLNNFAQECQRLVVIKTLMAALTFNEIIGYLDTAFHLINEVQPLIDATEQRIVSMGSLFLSPANERYLANVLGDSTLRVIDTQQLLICAAQIGSTDWVLRTSDYLNEMQYAYFSLHRTEDARNSVWGIQNRAEQKIGVQQVVLLVDKRILAVDGDGDIWVFYGNDPGEISKSSYAITAFAVIGREMQFVGSTVAINPLATTSESYTPMLLRQDEKEPENLLSTQIGMDSVISSSADGNYLAVGSQDHGIYLWNIKDGQQRQIFNEFMSPFLSIVVSSDGQSVFATLQNGGHIHCWQRSDNSITEIKKDGSIYTQLALSADGRYLVSATNTGVIQIWDTHSRKEEKKLEGHSGEVTRTGVSADGTLIVTAGDDHTIRLWDWQGKHKHVRDVQRVLGLITGENRLSHQIAHLSIATEITSLDISPDGSQIAAGDIEGNVYVWDVVIPSADSKTNPTEGAIVD